METRVKKALTCRDLPPYRIEENLNTTYLPKAGDVALFRVLQIGKHNRLQNDDGKNRYIFPNDLILCAFGNRYATNQIEGYVPDRILEEYHILGQGGVVGEVRSMFKPLEEQGPTTLELIGYAVDQEGRVINTKWPVSKLSQAASFAKIRSKVILSLGTSMDSGKTTTAGYLCRGLSRADKSVAYLKLTGTIFGKDPGFAYDCGADTVMDFSHFGFPSTYLCSEEELLLLFDALLSKLASSAPDYVVVEIADGLLQRETRMLLTHPGFMQKVHSVIFSAGDSLGVLSGLQILEEWGIRPFAVGGCFTMSPLLIQEVKENCAIDVLTLDQLEEPVMHRYFELEPKLQPVREIRSHVA